jgi:hypothetical protein
MKRGNNVVAPLRGHPRLIRSSFSASEQRDGWPSFTPTRLLVPKLDALDYALISSQIQRLRFAASIDSFPKLQLFVRAIFEVYYDAVKLNRRIINANLKLPEPSLGSANRNLIVIGVSIDMFIPQMNPWVSVPSVSSISLPVEHLSTGKHQQQQRKDRQTLSHSHAFSPY